MLEVLLGGEVQVENKVIHGKDVIVLAATTAAANRLQPN